MNRFNSRYHRSGIRGGTLLAMVAALGFINLSTAKAGGPIDAPESAEPRVPVAKCLSFPGLSASKGNGKSFTRVYKGDTLFSRDLLVVIPGFKVDVAPESDAVRLTLWGNLPGLSDSPVLESSVVLHDSKTYDLDFTLVRGRVVIANTRKEGAAKVWMRTPLGVGVQITLPNPGDTIIEEIYGRWPAGVPFQPVAKPGHKPVQLWEIFCVKGKAEVKTPVLEYYLTEPPGACYFHGDSVNGPSSAGPEKREKAPDWWLNSRDPQLMNMISAVVASYLDRLKDKDPDEVGEEILAQAEKEPNRLRGRLMRYLVVHAIAAHDDIGKVVEVLEHSKHDEMRKAAVVALRHWIGAREGRDQKLFQAVQDHSGYTKSEAETLMQLLHSPFDPEQPETYETLIAYLKHRKQAVRELAHWHLVRLAPVGRPLPFDSSADGEARIKYAAEWKKLIPTGELPKDPEEKPKETEKEKDPN